MTTDKDSGPITEIIQILRKVENIQESNEELFIQEIENASQRILERSRVEFIGVAFRKYNTSLLDQETAQLHHVLQLVDLALTASEKGILDQTIPLILIEDTLDALTVQTASQLFDYLESRVKRFTMNMESTKGKGLVLLRFCNELLRRMPKTKNADMCGRILTFISNAFPLTERSGVNLKGQFNVDNVTTYDEERTEDSMDVDESDPEKEKAKEDERFYSTFWSAQKYLSNPGEILDYKNFEIFSETVKSIISKFEAILDQSDKGSGSERKSGLRRHGEKSSSHHTATTTHSSNKDTLSAHPGNKQHDHFFPKFLTSKNLFHLELEDPNLRRQVLSQLVIVFQFLISLSPDDKAKITKHYQDTKGVTLNRGVQYAYTLTSEQEKWIIETRVRCFRLLERTPPNGKTFFKTLWTILAHEKNWIRWKLENCQAYEKPAFSVMENVKRGRADPSMATSKTFMGTKELTWLWESGRDVPNALKERARRIKAVGLDKHLQELDYQVEEDGETLAEGMEDAEYVLYNQPRYNWLAYRIASRQDLHIFNSEEMSGNPGKLLLLSWRKDRNPPASVVPVTQAKEPETTAPLSKEEEVESTLPPVDLEEPTDSTREVSVESHGLDVDKSLNATTESPSRIIPTKRDASGDPIEDIEMSNTIDTDGPASKKLRS